MLLNLILLLSISATVWMGWSYYTSDTSVPADLEKSSRIFEATVSRHLVPRFDPILTSGDQMTIVGCDGKYHATVGGQIWVEGLERWLKRGVNIDYLIVDGVIDDCVPLAQLAKDYYGSFNLFFVDVTPQSSTKYVEAAQALLVSHPVFVSKADSTLKAMWFENYHKPGSHIALNVHFIAPKDIGRDHFAKEYIELAQVLIAETASVDVVELEETICGNPIAA